MTKKKILVTGGLGFIGSHLIKMLLTKKYNILNIDKITYASQKLNIKNKNYSFHKIDLCNYKSLKNKICSYKPNIIINCAAETHVDRSIDNPKNFINSNIIGTFNILEILKNLKTMKYIHISTDEVFGSINKGKFNEKSNYKPNSPYAASKASSDHLVRAYGSTYGINFCITNCTNNYGPYQYPEKLIPVVINKCIKKEKIPVYGDGKNIRDWIYVKDHCNALLKIIKSGKKGKTYLLGGNNELSNIEIVNQICEMYDKITKNKNNSKNLISFVKDRKGHDFRYAINIKQTSKDLRWKPKINFKKGLETTISFYINNYNKLNKIYKFDNCLKQKIK
jgi:dTDP-glucose 4,6-dehydratase